LADPFLNRAASSPTLDFSASWRFKALTSHVTRLLSQHSTFNHQLFCTSEYRIEHPRWKFCPTASYELRADIVALYGERFLPPLTAPPASASIADGSFVTVYRRGDCAGA
jgi:hypothetical protein